MARTKALLIAFALLAAACSRPPRVIVGSKNFTEQVLLGEILSQQIERRMHVAVERKLDLGGTLLAHEALVRGDIDLYPEYTGTALTAILKQQPGGSPVDVLEQVRVAYRARWHLLWEPPLGFNDTFAMMVRGADARRDHLESVSDAARAHAWKLGVGYEFQQRPDGLSGLVRAYGLRTQGAPVSMDLGLLYTALEKGSVDMIAANSTDGLASAKGVAILADDRHFFPPYQCAVVLRQDALVRFPSLGFVLGELSGKISDGAMRRMNYEVDGKHRPVSEIAREFLKDIR